MQDKVPKENNHDQAELNSESLVKGFRAAWQHMSIQGNFSEAHIPEPDPRESELAAVAGSQARSIEVELDDGLKQEVALIMWPEGGRVSSDFMGGHRREQRDLCGVVILEPDVRTNDAISDGAGGFIFSTYYGIGADGAISVLQQSVTKEFGDDNELLWLDGFDFYHRDTGPQDYATVANILQSVLNGEYTAGDAHIPGLGAPFGSGWWPS